MKDIDYLNFLSSAKVPESEKIFALKKSPSTKNDDTVQKIKTACRACISN